MPKKKPEIIPHPDGLVPGWYWVKTRMYHRTPFKKWVIVELVYEPVNLEIDENPYCWIDANCDEFYGDIIEVGQRIPEPEDSPSIPSQERSFTFLVLLVEPSKEIKWWKIARPLATSDDAHLPLKMVAESLAIWSCDLQRFLKSSYSDMEIPDMSDVDAMPDEVLHRYTISMPKFNPTSVKAQDCEGPKDGS